MIIETSYKGGSIRVEKSYVSIRRNGFLIGEIANGIIYPGLSRRHPVLGARMENRRLFLIMLYCQVYKERT